MHEKVLEELKHIPKGAKPQGTLRMVYWARRMNSLSKKSADEAPKEVLEKCFADLTDLQKDYPNSELEYDREFFR